MEIPVHLVSTHDILEAVLNNPEVFLTSFRLDFGPAWIRMARECCIKIFDTPDVIDAMRDTHVYLFRHFVDSFSIL